METELDIEHDGLGPDPNDDGDDNDTTMVTASILMPGGMRYTGTVWFDGDDAPPPGAIAEALARAAIGAAAIHSPAAHVAIACWVRHPEEP